MAHSFTILDGGRARLTPEQEDFQHALADKNRIGRGRFVRDVDESGNAVFLGYMKDIATGTSDWHVLVPGKDE